MIRVGWQSRTNRSGGVTAAIRIVFMVCLLAATTFNGVSVNGIHGERAAVAAHLTVMPNPENIGGDTDMLPDEGGCVLHAICQGVIPATASAWNGSHVATPLRPDRRATLDSVVVPPLPQPPDFS